MYDHKVKAPKDVLLCTLECADIEIKLGQFIELLKLKKESIPEEFRDSAKIDLDFYDGHVDFDIYYTRPETDEEFEKRVNNFNARAEAIKQKEYSEYLRLLKLFGAVEGNDNV